jgi:uncharacterized protein (TIGR03435 family)
MLLAQSSPAPVAASSTTQTVSATVALAFDVATIKPIPPDGRPTRSFVGMQTSPDGMEFDWQKLTDLLCYAYGYNSVRFDGQITGLPDWALTQRYDLVAKMSAADITSFQKLSNAEQEQWREAMMRSLLAERFSLTLHHGTKQIPVYHLVVAKESSNFVDSTNNPNPPLGKGDDGKPHQGTQFLKDTSTWQAWSMENFSGFLSAPAYGVGRPVLDKTGMTSTYDFHLNWSVYSARPAMPNAATGDATEPDDTTSIFAALKAVGLRLQPATGPMETIVVDHVEKPTEN